MSPIYLQRPFKLQGEDKTRLHLYEITPEQAKRLTDGPLRQETFTVNSYETKQPVALQLNVGSSGGRFRPAPPSPPSPGPGVQPSPGPARGDANYGTAKPSGLSDMEL